MTTPTAAKRELRARLRARRRAMDAGARDRAAAAITATLLGMPEVAAARGVAAYHSFGSEPGTTDLLRALVGRGVRVLLPVLATDNDLDWAIYDQSGTGRVDRSGVWTPDGPRLGVAAVAAVDVVVVPALAVDVTGRRLGRGGGSYDRVLARVPAATAVVALLYDGEVLADVPAEPHDRQVSAAVTPSGVHRFAAAGATRQDHPE